MRRAAASVGEDLERIEATAANYGEASINRFKAQVVYCASHYLIPLYTTLSSVISERNELHKLDQGWIALVFIYYSADIVATTSVVFARYQLLIALFSDQINANTALAEAVRAFAVGLTAMQIWEASNKKIQHYRQHARKSRLQKIRTWVAYVICLKSRSSRC